ncbi:phospholipase C [Conexibacter woesei]|uniref:phospholipase C n=1 Tax=Conexibacter woesei TaxID=191495 RepID=UPI0003F7B92C|nr:alkaline phosphatase family protein [Conexibacter woesei]
MTGRLRLSPRVLTAAALSTLAAALVGWLTLAHGSSPAVDSTTQIKHVVVIFDENESFDHYFGTYPNAENRAGEHPFTARGGTPSVDGLTPALLTANPNRYDPARLPPSRALTCDANHAYSPEQAAFNNGAMDKFVENTGGACSVPGGNLVMDYFDGNTVTGLWNLAQNFSMSDNYFGSSFGPSTPGALNLIAGSTHGASPAIGNSIVDGTMIADPDPALDDCANGSATMSGRNVGDLLNDRGVTWGWFQGGFRPTSRSSAGVASCGSAHRNIGGASVADYSAHHEPFMYYASTANQHHLPPTSVANIGHSDQANHQYDLADFDNAVRADNLPQVSFLKAAAFEDGHPGYSDPLDEQNWIARVVNEVEQSPDWASTAIVITYDDSDGWYDHVNAVSKGSNLSDGSDQAICRGAAGAGDPDYAGRCGPGPRLPLLVVSPWAKTNDVESAQLEQASVTRFIEDNWNLGRLSSLNNPSFDARAAPAGLNALFDFAGGTRAPKVYLDPATGQVVSTPPSAVTSPNGADVPATTTTTTTTTTGTTPPPGTTTTTATTPAPPATTPARPGTPSRSSARLGVRPASYRARRSGKKLTLTFTYKGVTASKGRLTVSAKAMLNRRTVATAATKTIRSGRAALILRARKAIKKGRYTFTLRFRQGRLTATITTKAITIR